jgi:rare lipoprotein A
MASKLLLLLFLLPLGVVAQTLAPGQEVYFGTASYYAQRFEGRRTASGERFRQDSLTAAHKTLPLGSWVRVTNRQNGKSVLVRINDRMAKSSPHLIDLSRKAAQELGFFKLGTATVSIELIPTLPVVEELIELPAENLELTD